MSQQYVDRGPSRIGRGIAILAAACAVGLVANESTQRLALAIELGGLLVLALGIAAGRRGFRVTRAGVGLLGLGAIAAAVTVGTVTSTGITERVAFLPGALGVAIVGWGLLPTASAGSRRRVAVGVGFVVAGVLASGVMRGTTARALLGALAAAVVSWDSGERAISLGEQVGRAADTAAVELVHAAATVTVGVAGVLFARLVYDVGVTDVPLAGLMLLLAAALALSIALYAR